MPPQRLRNTIKRIVFGLLVLAAIPIVLLTRFVRPLVLIRFGVIRNTRIGHLGANTELYLCEREAGIPKGRVADFFFLNGPPSNRYLSKKLTQKVSVAHVVRVIASANRRVPGGERQIIRSSDMDTHDLLGTIGPHLSFSAEEERLGLSALEEMGVSRGTPYVCLYARDSAYLDTTYPSRESAYHDYRNASIENSLPAANELVRRGYVVLRMGAVVEQALETDNLKIIDYAANYRSDFLDIFLSANCEFFIGSTGGFTALPRIFRRPMAQVNFAPLGWNALLTCTPSNLVIPKKLWLRSESRYMIFPEIIGSGADEFATTRQFEELGIDVIENSPGEIADLAIELDERVRGVWQSRGEDEELQRRFWSLFKPDGASISFLPRIGAAFLREHRDLVA